MSIRWHEPDCAEDSRIFDSLWEAEKWGDAIRGDINMGTFDGYITADEKVAFVLAFHLACNEGVRVHASQEWTGKGVVYKVWVSRLMSYLS